MVLQWRNPTLPIHDKLVCSFIYNTIKQNAKNAYIDRVGIRHVLTPMAREKYKIEDKKQQQIKNINS